MGSSSSKVGKAAGSAVRKYPNRPTSAATTRPAAAPAPPQAPKAGPSVHPPPQASEAKTPGMLHQSQFIEKSAITNVDRVIVAIDLDARDPAFASRLNTLGAVQPNPHYSPTSISQFDPQRNRSSNEPSDMMQAPPASAFPDPRNNPVLRVLEARQRISDVAEDELRNLGRKSFAGRTYVDAGVITLALMRRARGEPENRIEEALSIKQGRLSVLREGTVGPVQLEG